MVTRQEWSVMKMYNTHVCSYMMSTFEKDYLCKIRMIPPLSIVVVAAAAASSSST